jgi:dihydrofolate reductase
MRPVVLQVFDLSLDGVIGEEGTEFYEFCRAVPDSPEHDAWLVGSLERARVHIMGRVTYEEMARYFPTASDDVATVMNRTPKAVFSRTLQAADWAYSTIMSGDTVQELDALRRQGTGEILAHGGVSFAQSLATLDVVDEYRLTVFPYVAGAGQRLFGDLPSPRRLELVSTTTFPSGVVALSYRRCR